MIGVPTRIFFVLSNRVTVLYGFKTEMKNYACETCNKV